MEESEQYKLKKFRSWMFELSCYENLVDSKVLLKEIIHQFDTFFSPKEIDEPTVTRKQLYLLWTKHGGKKDTTRCPICTGDTQPRQNKKNNTRFYGCMKFPDCKGIRDAMGNPSFNTELAIHLVKMENKKIEEKQTKDLGRFADL